MNDSLKLSAKAIYDKKFPKDIKGYDAYEVDAFLDLIIADYTNMENFLVQNDEYVDRLKQQLDDLMRENGVLKETKKNLLAENQRLEQQVGSFQNRFNGIKESDAPNKENLRLIQQINVLTEQLKGKGYSDEEIQAVIKMSENK